MELNQRFPGKFDFGRTGNRIVLLLGFMAAAASLALPLWCAARVLDLAQDVWRARHWTVVQASVLHVSMQSAAAPSRLGYYKVRTRYRYVQHGNSFESGRLMFTGQMAERQVGASVQVWNGRWLATVVDFIEHSRLAGRPLPVFVNPSDPAEAVVFRDMPWGNYLMRSLALVVSGVLPAGAVTPMMPQRCKRAARLLTAVLAVLVFPGIAAAGAAMALMAAA